MPESNSKRILIIACEVFHREISALAARSPKVVDFVFLPKGLHDLETAKMRARIQEEIDKADSEKYEFVVLAYGLCNNGTLGLAAREAPLVIPRAHDCITLFFGSRSKYREYFDSNPGTYYYTTGWTERGKTDLADNIMSQLGLSSTYNEYVEKYGKDNADYIMKVLGGWRENYKKLTYIKMPVDGLPDYTELSKAEAETHKWQFEVVDGDTAILNALATGDWESDEFVVVRAGETLSGATGDEIFSAGLKDAKR